MIGFFSRPLYPHLCARYAGGGGQMEDTEKAHELAQKPGLPGQ